MRSGGAGLRLCKRFISTDAKTVLHAEVYGRYNSVLNLISCILEEDFDDRPSESPQSLRRTRVKSHAGGCQYCLDQKNFAILDSRDAIGDIKILNGYLKVLSLGKERDLLGLSGLEKLTCFLNAEAALIIFHLFYFQTLPASGKENPTRYSCTLLVSAWQVYTSMFGFNLLDLTLRANI